MSIYGSDADQKETLAVLGRARGRVRTLLGSRVRLRATPEIRFVFDPSVEFSIRLEQILDQERATRPAAFESSESTEEAGEEAVGGADEEEAAGGADEEEATGGAEEEEH